MHAAVRNYSGPGAKKLFERLEKNKKEVKKLIRGVSGFESYSLISTDDGGISVTVCKNKKGTDQSIQIAKDWVQKNAPDLNPSPPLVSEGEVIINT